MSTPPNELDPEHLAELQASDLTVETIEANGLHSVRGGQQVRDILGGYLDTKTAAKMGPCLAFPYRDGAGEAIEYADKKGVLHPFIRLKPDHPRKGYRGDSKGAKKDRPIKYESPFGSKSRAYIPFGTREALLDPTIPLLITEGEKKSLCADQHGLRCIGLGGMWNFGKVRTETDIRGKKTGPRELIDDLDQIVWAGRAVTIVPDSDVATNPEIAWACWTLGELLRDQAAVVRIAMLPAEAGGGKNGLDDYVVRHGIEALKTILQAAAAPERPEGSDPRPKIIIGTDEYRVNQDAIVSLSSENNLYQRAGSLVSVVRTDAYTSSVIKRPPGSPTVRDVPPTLLRERMTRAARWVAIRGSGKKKEEHPAHPPDWCVSAVHARAVWPGIRQLEAVVNHPVVLRDGTILAANGYDAKSGLLVSIPSDLQLKIPENPNNAEVKAAVKVIDDLIGDFPFDKPAHRAAWYAGFLTPLARFSYEGPAPMLLIDGNTRGVGKGLLADMIALPLTGRRFSVMSYSADKEELRKKITSLAAEGERLVLMDNLAGNVGNDVLDMALTTDRWKDRLLGANRIYDGPLHVVWYATGNNVQLGADTSRRCSHCRLETEDERPELRANVKYPNLRRHAIQQRGPMLSAALTILRGWHSAGCPRHKLPPWGSFDGWSDCVREAVVFAGLSDPGDTRTELQSNSDRDAATMIAMIDAISRMDPISEGKTTASIIEAIRKPGEPIPAWHADLKSAVEELCGRLDGRVLGLKFRHFARRNFNGRMIDKAGTAGGGVVRWAVYSANGARKSGDGGDGGNVPAQTGCEGEI